VVYTGTIAKSYGFSGVSVCVASEIDPEAIDAKYDSKPAPQY